MDSTESIKKKIREVISNSSVPEDPRHSQNTLEWLLKLEPGADVGLQIAALGHDIERAIDERKIKRQDYDSYDDFKQSHASRSAVILGEIMRDCHAPPELIDDVFHLVEHHETGYDHRVDLLNDADSLSFFQINLPYYFTRNDINETKRRFLWGYGRLSDNLKKIIAEFDYSDNKLMLLVKEWLASFN